MPPTNTTNAAAEPVEPAAAEPVAEPVEPAIEDHAEVAIDPPPQKPVSVSLHNGLLKVSNEDGFQAINLSLVESFNYDKADGTLSLETGYNKFSFSDDVATRVLERLSL